MKDELKHRHEIVHEALRVVAERKDKRTVTLPAGKEKGSKNIKPTLHPNYADALIKLASMVTLLDSPDLQKAAMYVHKLGMYLKTPEYEKARAYRRAAKIRSDERHGVK